MASVHILTPASSLLCISDLHRRNIWKDFCALSFFSQTLLFLKRYFFLNFFSSKNYMRMIFFFIFTTKTKSITLTEILEIRTLKTFFCLFLWGLFNKVVRSDKIFVVRLIFGKIKNFGLFLFRKFGGFGFGFTKVFFRFSFGRRKTGKVERPKFFCKCTALLLK